MLMAPLQRCRYFTQLLRLVLMPPICYAYARLRLPCYIHIMLDAFLRARLLPQDIHRA